MPFFRKKPVVIEARELTVETAQEIMAWCGSTEWWSKGVFRQVRGIIVPTQVDASTEAAFGDWIIKGTKGEFYPCKPDILTDIYDPAEVV